MLSFLKKIFGAKPSETSAAPYKVETPVALGEPPATVVIAVEGAGAVEIPPAEKKTVAKKVATAIARAPRKRRAPKV